MVIKYCYMYGIFCTACVMGPLFKRVCCVGSTIALSQITFPHSWNIIGNGKNMPRTFVDCSQCNTLLSFPFTEILLVKDEPKIQLSLALTTAGGSCRASMVAGKVLRCWSGRWLQYMSSMLKASWVNVFIFKIIQVISSGNQTCCGCFCCLETATC